MSPNHSSVTTEPEKVYTVTDFYDGPRCGIADFQGRPHIYKSLFPDEPAEADVFVLQPIDEETFCLAMEDWAIWCRWERAFHSQRTTHDTHPALPEDRLRHDELEAILAPRLRIQNERAFKAQGSFYARTPTQPGLTCTADLMVCWKSCENAT